MLAYKTESEKSKRRSLHSKMKTNRRKLKRKTSKTKAKLFWIKTKIEDSKETAKKNIIQEIQVKAKQHKRKKQQG